MKAIIVMGRLADGGLERVQFTLAEQLAKHGIEIAIAARATDHHPAITLQNGVRLLEAPSRSILLFPFWLMTLLRRERPDVVLTTANDIACLLILGRQIAALKVRIVATQHTSVSGPILHARGASRLKLLTIRWLLSLLIGRADAIVAVSQSVADDMTESLGIPRHLITTIYNPAAPTTTRTSAEPDRSPLEARWGPGHPPVICFIGRLAPEKRIDLLLDAFDELRRSQDARLAVIGSGPLEPWLRGEVQRRGIEQLCWMPGFLKDAMPVLRRSAVLVLPSDYEGFAMVLVEALSCGVQVVSTDCKSGPREILEAGRLGSLVPTNNSSALCAAIASKLSGETVVPVEALRERAKDFSVDRAVTAYARLLKSLVGD